MVEKYNVSLKKLLQQGISKPEFYGVLVYRLRKIVGKFPEQFRIKLINRYKRIGYNLYIMRQIACIVINPITVDSYAFRFNFTAEVRASDSMAASSTFNFMALSQFHLISTQSLYLGGRRGSTDGVATIHFHPSLSSAALRESPNPIPVHSLMLSSHLFFCLPLLLAPFTVPCYVFAMPEDLEMWPYHLFSFLYHG